MLGRRYNKDTVGKPIAESRDRALTKEWRDRGTRRDVERELNAAVSGVDSLTAWAARSGESPAQFTGRDGHPRRDDEIGHDIGHGLIIRVSWSAQSQ
jgi:hypothetical protein